jgi:hypothetical protein
MRGAYGNHGSVATRSNLLPAFGTELSVNRVTDTVFPERFLRIDGYPGIGVVFGKVRRMIIIHGRLREQQSGRDNSRQQKYSVFCHKLSF